MSGGWTSRDDTNPVPREDVTPSRFFEEKTPGDPACAAWDEPGYQDPDAPHADLPLGAHYWQGFAKQATPREERAMSPGWVCRVTERGGIETPPPFTESDPLRERVVRVKETEKLSWHQPSFWPG